MKKKYFFSIKEEGVWGKKYLLYGDVGKSHRIFRLICVQNYDENEIKEIVENLEYLVAFEGHKVQCIIGEGKDEKKIERWVYTQYNHYKDAPYSKNVPDIEFVEQLLREFESECTD